MMASPPIKALFAGVLVVLTLAIVVYVIVPLFSEVPSTDRIAKVTIEPKPTAKKTIPAEQPTLVLPILEEVKVRIPEAKQEEKIVEKVPISVTVEKVACVECAEQAARGDIKGCEGIQDVGARDACLLMTGSRDCKTMKSEIGKQTCEAIVK